MSDFETVRRAVKPVDIAPDGSHVRLLLQLGSGSMAHFEFGPAQTGFAVAHRTVEEIWYFIAGKGEMWRKQGDREEIVSVEAGVCITIPLGTTFQFRSFGYTPLEFVVVTMPPWPGGDEADVVEGRWQPTASTQSLKRI
jgi:mannose-6-phosphate isomerase-like protein (cupin superfamily)